jgi:hypothetical protein
VPKQAWLNVPFLFARNGVALLLLTGLSLALVYYSLRGDRQWLAEKDPSRGLSELGSWEESWRSQKILSPIIGFAYAFILTLMAFDLTVPRPHWRSTPWGYYFMGSFYTAIAHLPVSCSS